MKNVINHSMYEVGPFFNIMHERVKKFYLEQDFYQKVIEQT